MSFLHNLNWRFATKTFVPEKKVSESDLKQILEAIRLTPTSFGLCPFHVKVISNPEIKAELRSIAWDQSQITDCSHLLVFCVNTDVQTRITELITAMNPENNAMIASKLDGYEKLMRSFTEGMSEDRAKAWTARQAYIALGFAMAACAELQIDSCPIEGFDPEKTNEILKLPPTLQSVVMLPIGYRQDEPTHPKFRFDADDMFSFQ